MGNLTCTLLPHAVSEHLQQIYTGYVELARRGLVDLKQSVARNEAGGIGRTLLRVRLGNGSLLAYDMHDGEAVDAKVLATVDHYFKRSYSAKAAAQLGPSGAKVHPLGLNYHVFPNGSDLLALRRSLALRDRRESVRALLRALRAMDAVRFVERLDAMAALPAVGDPPRVLFMARTWDPDAALDGSAQRAADRRAINDMRAECIRALRSAFGDDFYGGFSHTAYAQRHYADCLVPDGAQASKDRYLGLLRSHAICVATTGLHGSIGWKFAEYVAFSKAIVSERLNYEVPGDLAEGTNYLCFDSPEACVAQARRLYDDAPLRTRMMTANARYYDAFVRPDALVLNSILTALALDA